jgi:TonB family protein
MTGGVITRRAVLVCALAAGACASGGAQRTPPAPPCPQKVVGVSQHELESSRSQLLSLGWLPDTAGYTVAGLAKRPVLKNASAIARRLANLYPRDLRDAGIGGTTRFYVIIDDDGRVARSQMKATSGHAAYDRVAAQLLPRMEFEPAVHDGCRLPFFEVVPIVFAVSNGRVW